MTHLEQENITKMTRNNRVTNGSGGSCLQIKGEGRKKTQEGKKEKRDL